MGGPPRQLAPMAKKPTKVQVDQKPTPHDWTICIIASTASCSPNTWLLRPMLQT
jgi:hypothetical protein